MARLVNAAALLLLAALVAAQDTPTVTPIPATTSMASTDATTTTTTTAAPATTTVAPSTSAPVPTPAASTGLSKCPGTRRVDTMTSQTVISSLQADVASVPCDSLRTFTLAAAPVGDATFQVNFNGTFRYDAPPFETANIFTVTVSCLSTPLCNLDVVISVARPLTGAPTPSSATPAPPPAVTQINECPQVYYFTVGTNTTLSDSLRAKAGQLPCANGRSYTKTRDARLGFVYFYPIGDFRYGSPSTSAIVTWDDFGFTMYCQGVLMCTGTAYIQIADTQAPVPTPAPPAPPGSIPTPAPPGSTATPSPPQASVSPMPFMTCSGSCNTDAWKAMPKEPDTWDVSPVNGAPPRQDGRAVDAVEAMWDNGNLVLRAYGKIGNVANRFPSFESVLFRTGDAFSDDELRSRIAETSVPFDISCLGTQATSGLAELVWSWTSIVNRTGRVGSQYASGNNWYQKFGGKHVNCDTFLADSCRFAPLLTPKTQQDASMGGVWSVEVDGCDVKWTGVFSFAAMRNMRKIDGTPVFQMADGQRVRTLIRSEVLKPQSHVDPRFGIFTQSTDRDIAMVLEPWTRAYTDEANGALFSVDLEYFPYTADNGDKAFGLNVLFYPHVQAGATTSYMSDRHVNGFRWVTQSWTHPDLLQCPTCTGFDNVCSIDTDALIGDASFTSNELLAGTCHNPRIILSRGPKFTTDDCPANRMHVFNRPGFSAPRYCRKSYQNLTIRGIAPGSAGSNSSASFAFEGNIRLQLLLDNGQKPFVDLKLDMIVGMSSADGVTVGATNVCRSGLYWPVYDPLGTSTPDKPHALSLQQPVEMCVDRFDRTFGPNGWALVSYELNGTDYSQVNVESLYMKYAGSSTIYLLRNDPTTGQPLSDLPTNQDAVWWYDVFPFLNFRDLSSRLANQNQSLSVAQGVDPITNQVYAFIFTPGGISVNTEVALTAVLRVGIPNSTSFRRVTFARMIMTDRTLTAISRWGPPEITTVAVEEAQHNTVFAMAASGSLLFALLFALSVFAIADTKRPLPKWMPRTLLKFRRKSKKPGKVTKRATVGGIPVASPTSPGPRAL